MKILEIKPILTLDADSTKKLITFGITEQGTVYWLELNGRKDYSEQVNGPVFPKIFPDARNNYTVKFFLNGKIESFDLLDQEMNYHLIVPVSFPDIWIVANARSRFDKNTGTGDKNVKVVNRSGQQLHEFCFGDGLQKILVDGGLIWTSYFDEGVYGNFGWDEPIGRTGLVSWDMSGQMAYEYENSEADSISDCYAANAFNGNVYIHYYTAFPFVRIDSQLATRTLKLDFSGSDFALTDEYALFRKAYSKDDKVHLFRIQESTVVPVEELRLKDGWVRIVPGAIYTAGRHMCILAKSKFYVIDAEKVGRTSG